MSNNRDIGMNWIMSQKYEMKDITFIIPFHKDSEERLENLICIIENLSSKLNTNILVVESANEGKHVLPKMGIPFGFDILKYDQIGGIFHRTRVINEGIKACKTKYFCNYDTDVLFLTEQLISAAAILRGGTQIVYPYSGHFIDIARSYLKDGIIHESVSFATESTGGAVFMEKDAYWRAGLENENIYGWGFEDICRFHRLKTLRYYIARVDGKCWHITHPRGINSSNQNPHDAVNQKEYEKVKAMNKEELEKYISTWAWTYIPQENG